MHPDLDELIRRAVALRKPRRRAVLGIAGAPAAGKSTLAERLAAAVNAPIVGMDGFHLSNGELERRGRLDAKGAPDTFVAAGYVQLITRLHQPVTQRAPVFDRAREESVQDALEIPAEASLVITEGNYLLLDEPPWNQLDLDECWFVELPEATRLERLIERHVRYGRSPLDATTRATEGIDAVNAALVAASKPRADLLITDV